MRTVTVPSTRVSMSGAAKIWILIVTMALTAGAVTLSVVNLEPIETPFRLPWPALIPLVFLGEVAIVSLRFRRDAHVFSMSELPLVVGLFFVNPVGLIGAQLIGNALALGFKRRQPAKKLVFNLSLLTLQAALAVAAFHTILGPHEPLGGMGSVATLVAVGLGVITANVLINTAILLSGGGLNRREQLNTLALGAATAGMNASLGLVAVSVMWTRPGTLWAAAVPPIALYLAYRAYVAQREEGQRMEALYEATRALLGSPQIESAMLASVHHARLMFDAERAEIRVFRSGVRGEAFRTAIGPGEESVVMERVHPNGLDSVWETDASLLNAQLMSCDTSGHSTPGHTVTHQMTVPVEGPDGVCGIIMVSEPLTEARNFTRQDLRFLETLASQISISLENGRLEDSLAHVTKLKDDLRHQAMHDVLTGLGNRALLWEAMANLPASATTGQAAVLLLDLDDFKSVNDTFGHQAGDEVLVEVAQRLLACCRPEDTVARLGGDEFAILLERMSSPGDATIVANRIAESLAQPIMISGERVIAQASMGIALVEGESDPQELMRQADQAMYSAKSSLKGTFSVFSDRRGSSLRRDLARAVSNDELVLHYQPIVDLESGNIKGVEALVRWNHPHRGLLAPDLFIPLAEETGLIVDIGRWVLNEACRQASGWHHQLTGSKPSLSVNFSPRELAEPDIVQAVATALRTAGLDPRHLIVEMTENVMMHSSTKLLDELKELGVRIAMDDFGVGYSSLSYLDKLPIDIVKIDRTFVTSLTGSESSPLVQLIVQIGDALGLETVAEGIETPEQLRLLRGLGCQTGQGYLFAKPMEAAAIAEMLSTSLAVGDGALGVN